MTDDSNQLEKFRKEWTKEISKSARLEEIHTKALKSGKPRNIASSSPGSETCKSSSNTGLASFDVSENASPSSNSGGVCNNLDILGNGGDVRKRKNTIESFLIAENLLKGEHISTDVNTTSNPTGDRVKDDYLERNKKLKLSSPVTEGKIQKTDSFLDIFIADLDEISEVPFFDVELPRELALRIFKYLNPLELCRCSQVSRAWRSLADDELLWNLICHDLGYDQSLQAVDQQNWKDIVKEHVTEEHRIRLNWKMRTGRYQTLDHVWGNVITSAHSCGNMIAAGYTTGDVKFWDLGTETECSFKPSSTALVVNEAADQGMLTNYVSNVATGPNYTAALYNQGNMDLWKNYGKSKHLKSFTCFTGSQAYSNLQLVMSNNGYFLACCYGNIIQTFGLDSFVCPSGDIENLETITLEDEQNLYHLKWLSSCSRDNLLAIAGLESVSIHKPGNDPSHMTKVHHVINQHVTAMDGSGGDLALAVSSLGDFKVRLYNIESGREEQQFKGHTSTIQCLNIEDSPQQSLVTGCHDKRVRVFDTRLPDPIMTLRGHGAPVSCVQMDDWKVASGGTDGLVCVWDQRLSRKLWDTHNRHPVKYLHFNNRTLITANIPNTKFPELYDNDDSSISARRDRGTISSYDFGTDQDNEAIPEICLSTYDQPDAYNYNIRLAVPYDNV